MAVLRRAHLVLALVFVPGVVVQVFLAGLGVFDEASAFETHRSWGYALELAPLLTLVLALLGRLGRRHVAYAAALFAMFLLQSLFVGLRETLPAIAALHPLNGFAILLVGMVAARAAWAARATPDTASAPAASAVGEPG